MLLSLARAVGTFVAVYGVTWLAFRFLIELPEEPALRYAVQTLPWLVAGLAAILIGARGAGQARLALPPRTDDREEPPSVSRTERPPTE